MAEPEKVLLMYLGLGVPSYPWTSWGANHVSAVVSWYTAKPQKRGPSGFLGKLVVSKS